MREMHGTQEIGVFLRTKRTDAGLTQAELAEKLHVTRQAISKWEQGRSEPDVNTLRHLAETLGFTMDELLGTAKDGESAARRNRRANLFLHPRHMGFRNPAPRGIPLFNRKSPLCLPVLSVRETSAGAGALLPLGAAGAVLSVYGALGGRGRGKRRRVRFRIRPVRRCCLFCPRFPLSCWAGCLPGRPPRLPRGFGFLLCALLTAGSVCALTQSLFPSFVFSSDAHGYLNSWLLQSARDPLHPFVPLDWFGNAPLLYEWAQSTAAESGRFPFCCISAGTAASGGTPFFCLFYMERRRSLRSGPFSPAMSFCLCTTRSAVRCSV